MIQVGFDVPGDVHERFAVRPAVRVQHGQLDGAAQGMYAIGLRESFPAGTCEETLFIDPLFPPEPGVCTPPGLGVVTLLCDRWRVTHLPLVAMTVCG